LQQKRKSETKAVGSTKQYQVFFIWQAIVRGQSVSTEGPFLFSGGFRVAILFFKVFDTFFKHIFFKAIVAMRGNA